MHVAEIEKNIAIYCIALLFLEYTSQGSHMGVFFVGFFKSKLHRLVGGLEHGLFCPFSWE